MNKTKKRSNIMTVARKEFARFFGDRQSVIMSLIFPGVFIYLIYTFLGTAIPKMYEADTAHTITVQAVNGSAQVGGILEAAGMQVTFIGGAELDAARSEIEAKSLDILIIFPDNFDDIVASYSADGFAAGNYLPPKIEIFYNSLNNDSRGAFDTVTAVLTTYESSIADAFDWNTDLNQKYDLVTTRDTITGMFSSLLTMLLLMMSLPSCVNLAATAIAGEKEMGTITTLLVTPLKRQNLALGKIISLSAIGFLCGMSSFIGVLFSLPKLMHFNGDTTSAIMQIYGFREYLLIILVVLSSMLLIVSLVSIISALAKTAKTATNIATLPLMIINIVLSLSVMLTDGAQTQLSFYFIPVYNTVQSLVGIFSVGYSLTNILITVVTNLIYAGVGAVVLTKIFDSERIMN